MSDAKEAMRVAKMLERVQKNIKTIAKNPYAKTAAKTAIGVGDLFGPVPGGKIRSAARLGNVVQKTSKMMKNPATKEAYKSIVKTIKQNENIRNAVTAAGAIGFGAGRMSKRKK